MTSRRVIAVLSVCLVAPGAARAFDCVGAASPLEKAICADPKAKASDDRLEAAFRTAKTLVGAESQAALLTNQRAWLKDRTLACADDKAPAACATDSNDARSLVLTAKPAAGPGGPDALVPVIVERPGSRSEVTTSIVLFRFADPQTAAAKTLNPLVETTIAEAPIKKDEPEDDEWTTEIKGRIAYASDRLLSLPVETYSYSGGAHGNSGTRTINIDVKTGRTLGFSDLVAEPNVAALAALCLPEIESQQKEKDVAPPDAAAMAERDKNIREVLVDLQSWTFEGASAEITFDPYTIGSFAEGPYSCTLPYARLRPLLKSGFPLP